MQELTWMPAWQIREAIGKREVSAREVTDHFLDRIEEHGATLRAFRHLDPDGARSQADRVDHALAAGDELGPVAGIPISFKEHISVAGMPVLGLGAGPDRLARFDDLAVTRLREAGAVVVGTNTMMGTQAEAGSYNWDAEARSPWDLERVPGWSSSGGAAAAAARLLPITIGTDGGGSTRLPASYSGLVGVHPTSGLVPSFNYGTKARRDPTVTLGPLARDVTDAAITLQVMAGPDGRDFDCLPFDAPDLLGSLEQGLDGLRMAWTDHYGFAGMYAFPESARVIATVREAASTVTDLGGSLDVTGEVWEDFFDGYVTTNFLFRGGDRPDHERWNAAMDVRQRNWVRFRNLFREHDLLLSPTSQLVAPRMEDWSSWWEGRAEPVPFPHGTFAPHYTSHTHLFNWLGFPAVSVPAGFVDGLPVGLQIVGPPGSDPTILRTARAFLRANPRDERPATS